MMKPRYFIFGLYRVPMWEYMCGMTAAQIEIMSTDKPLTLYGKRKKIKSFGTEYDIPDTFELEECRKKYEEEHKKDGGKVDMKDMMKNFN